MKRHDLKSMSVDQLWSLHKLVASVLARKILAEKSRLDQQLRQLVEPGATPANVKNLTRGALTRRCFRSIGILRSRPRLGRAAESSPAG